MTDTELMQQVLEAMGTVGADLICEASHHAKKDQHKWGEPCPLQQRWHIAYQALRDRLAQPEQDPVATVESVATVVSESGNQEVTMSWWHEPALPVGTKLYTTPPQRKPLTHPQIHEFDWPDGVSFEDILLFVRAIEAAHGIKGEA